MLTRNLRLLHVAQPLDFPGMPTMTKGFSINVKGDLNNLDAFHVILLHASLATSIYTGVFYIAT